MNETCRLDSHKLLYGSKPDVYDKLIELGFSVNKKTINGSIPNFSKGNDIVFLIGSNFGIRKFIELEIKFKGHLGCVYGVLTDKSPRLSAIDCIQSGMVLLNPFDCTIGVLSGENLELNYIKTKL